LFWILRSEILLKLLGLQTADALVSPTMSRSAADATRFTATRPFAHSKSPASATSSIWPGSKIRFAQPSKLAPGGASQETPKQKVERLRAEARAARIARSSSLLDRFIERGRVWADGAHKVTVFSLLAASGIAGILTIYSMSSLIIYNRRQRALWIDLQLQRLLEAKQAYVAGIATQEQLELLENEKAGEEERRRKEELKKQSVIYKGREWLLGGLNEEAPGNPAQGLGENDNERPGVLEAVNAQRLDSSITPEQPASQDGLLTETTNTTGAESKGWRSWITRR